MPTLAQNFEDYLAKTSEVSDKTLRNYRADLANFLKWSNGEETFILNISPFLIQEYLKSLALVKTPPATINRRLSTLRAFGKFLTKSGHIKDNPFTSFQNVANPKKSVVNQPISDQPITGQLISENRKPKTDNRKITYALTATVLFLLVVSIAQTYFLLKRPAAKGPKSSAVLGAAETGYRVIRRYPLPAPGVTFGDLLGH